MAAWSSITWHHQTKLLNSSLGTELIKLPVIAAFLKQTAGKPWNQLLVFDLGFLHPISHVRLAPFFSCLLCCHQTYVNVTKEFVKIFIFDVLCLWNSIKLFVYQKHRNFSQNLSEHVVFLECRSWTTLKVSVTGIDVFGFCAFSWAHFRNLSFLTKSFISSRCFKAFAQLCT